MKKSVLFLGALLLTSGGAFASGNVCFPVKQGNNQIAVCAMPRDLGTAISFSGFYFLTQSRNRVPFVTFYGRASIQSGDQPSLRFIARALCFGFSGGRHDFLNIDVTAQVLTPGLFFREGDYSSAIFITPTLPNGNIPVPDSSAQYQGGQIVQLVCEK
jgi:hypothetical protein